MLLSIENWVQAGDRMDLFLSHFECQQEAVLLTDFRGPNPLNRSQPLDKEQDDRAKLSYPFMNDVILKTLQAELPSVLPETVKRSLSALRGYVISPQLEGYA